MRKIGIILIASVMVLVMASSCRVVHIVTPEDFFETTGEVSATTAAREIDLNMLAKDIAEEAVDCMTTTLLTLTKQYLSAARKAVMEER